MVANRARIVPGLILIALGLVLLLMQFFRFGPGHFLFLLGLVFLIPYLYTRAYGLLIPACILAGLGLGLVFEVPEQTNITVPIGLGLGFIAIFIVQLVFAGRSHWWPLVPGVLLVLAGAVEGVPQGRALLEKGWPLALILIGLLILGGQFWGGLTGRRGGV